MMRVDARLENRAPSVTPEEWGSSRLEDLSQRLSALSGKYEDMAQRLTRLDEQGVNAAAERQEMRKAMHELTLEMRALLKEIDRSCQEKVDSVGRSIREEIRTQIALQLAANAKESSWSIRDRVPIYAAALTSAAALLAVVIK